MGDFISFNLYHLKVKRLQKLLEDYPNSLSLKNGMRELLGALNNEDLKMNLKLRDFLGMGISGGAFEAGLLTPGQLLFAKFPLIDRGKSREYNERNIEKQTLIYERELAIGERLGELNRPSFSTNYRMAVGISPPLILPRQESLGPLVTHEFGLVNHGPLLLGQYIPGKTLTASLNSLDTKSVLKIFLLIVEDLSSVKDFTHGDLHLANIIMRRTTQPYAFRIARNEVDIGYLETSLFGVLIDYGQAKYGNIAYQKEDFFLGTQFHIELYDVYYLMMNLLAEANNRLFEELKFLVRYFYRKASKIDRNFIAMKQRDINEANRKRFLIPSEFHRRTFADFLNWLYQQPEIEHLLVTTSHFQTWKLSHEFDFWEEVGINPLDPQPVISPLQWLLFDEIPFQDSFLDQFINEYETHFRSLTMTIDQEKKTVEEQFFETFNVAYLIAQIKRLRKIFDSLDVEYEESSIDLGKFHQFFISHKEYLSFFIRSLPNTI